MGMIEAMQTGAVRRLSVRLALVIPAIRNLATCCLVGVIHFVEKAGISLFKEDCLTAVLFFIVVNSP